MHIFGDIPLIKPQNDAETTDKRSKTTKKKKRKKKGVILFWLSFYNLFGAWKIVGSKYYVLWLDKGDFPEHLRTVYPS